MKLNNIPHIPVLYDAVVEVFSSLKSGTVIDCTVGYAGHSEAILKANPNIRLICIDQDQRAIDFSKKRLEAFSHRVEFVHGRFSDVVGSIEVDDVCGILADIGVSSLQLDDASRGFGFGSDRLDMRMDPRGSLSAKDVVNSYDQESLEKIFKIYGEVKEYKKAASLIVEERLKKPFESAKELADLLAKHLYSKKIHPATLVFQAIRIEVNDELGELQRLLQSIYDLQLSNALVAIISFHSLEDRIVKQTFKRWTNSCICPPQAMRCSCSNDFEYGKIVTKKPIIATEEEIEKNPRARSAKLRVFKTKSY